MSKTVWKFLSLFLICLLTGVFVLFGVPFTHQNLLAQSGKKLTCGQSSDWSYYAFKSMVERYGVDPEFVCGEGSFQSNNPDVRADIAEWIAIGLKHNEKSLQDEMQVLSQDIERLQRLYQEIDQKIDQEID
ncbi:hypothetical protein PN482_02155 [Microcystis aeruginosa CS-555/01A07]|uniref:hypothetical protein n=1 Tax=Microcystis aeruginosa TaxID=1126 RepID=UPI00232D2275|nr:hypothetical protein [Microcystis aeruginosa]MDB9427753.1 hypothetical protein [Microcystis aeruginosa CS-555/01A07]